MYNYNMSKLIERHICEPSVVSYYTSPYLYFNKEMRENYDFITETLPKGFMNECSDAGAYIIPIHKTKAEESGYTQHIYYEYMKMLRPYKILKEGKQRYYCITCKRLAREIKNEVLRPKRANECKSCYMGLR